MVAGFGRIDPGGREQPSRLREVTDETLEMHRVSGGQDLTVRVVGHLSAPVVDYLRGQEANARMAMLGVVPAKEVSIEGPGLFDRGESVGEDGPVLEGLELRLRIGIIVGDMRARMRLGDTEARQ